MAYLETAVEIAREAGALLAHYFEKRVAFELKGDFDLVTESVYELKTLLIKLETFFVALLDQRAIGKIMPSKVLAPSVIVRRGKLNDLVGH